MAPPPLDQSKRQLKISTPLGDNKLVLTGFSGREEMSRLFSFQLDLLSNTQGIDPKTIVGKKVTFSLKQIIADQPVRRLFHGIVNRFAAGNWDRTENVQQYSATVVPWLWMLTRAANCRIFQKKSVPEIILEVFTKRGFSGADYIDDSGIDKGRHPKWDYCVQYRETDFNFVSRLMEQEGIFYYFRFEIDSEQREGKHVLCLADKPVYPALNPAKVDFKGSTGGTQAFDGIQTWLHQFEFRPGTWSQTDYDFTQPRLSLLETEPMTEPYDAEVSYEIYDYPGEYEKEDKGGYAKNMTRVREEEEETPQDVVHGSANYATMFPGLMFSIGEHRNPEEQGKSYVLTSVQHVAHESASYASGTAASEDYSNAFTCIPSNRTFRPTRLTPKPVVQGTQTAIVVGPNGDEIYTDATGYGQVKVQFHWDREGKRNENSSCWIRVAQNWAGKRWGAFFLPRIGQEVIVSFLEGDPDRPIIVGSVYNADQMPPYLGNGLDDKHKHDPNVSGFKSNSTKGGEGYNELRFNDTAAKEQIFIHAQKDMDTRIQNDFRERICANHHLIVGGDKEDGDKQWGDRFEKIHGDTHLHVRGQSQEHVEKAKLIAIDGDLDQVIGKNQTELIKGNADEEVKGNRATKVGGAESLTVGQDLQTKAGMNLYSQAGMDIHIKAGMNLVLEAGMNLSLKVGGSFISLTPAALFISGPMVNINTGGAAGAGPGANPTAPKQAKTAAPKEPEKADKSKSGKKSAYDS